VLNKQYGDTQFKENIKELYNIAGPGGGAVTFILTDAEIKSETFLEMINSMLATGEIPGLHSKEDRDLIPLQQKTVYMKEAGTKGEDPSTLLLWQYFINRVKDNLHTVLCFSPVGNKFRACPTVPLPLLPVQYRLVLALARGGTYFRLR